MNNIVKDWDGFVKRFMELHQNDRLAFRAKFEKIDGENFINGVPVKFLPEALEILEECHKKLAATEYYKLINKNDAERGAVRNDDPIFTLEFDMRGMREMLTDMAQEQLGGIPDELKGGSRRC